MSKNRIAGVIPTRMVLGGLKIKLKGAKKGWELLKMKADSLKAHFAKVMKELATVKEGLGDEVKRAHMMQAQAEYSAGNIKPKLLE